MGRELNTEERIIATAKEVFIKKGLDGARMQDIADEAGINKALLHYYFRSKEKLFDIIFQQAFANIVPRIGAILNEDISLFEKIQNFIATYITVISENPHIPLFILHEVQRNPARLLNKMNEQPLKPILEKFMRQIKKEIKAGNIIQIEPVQLLINMLALSVFPFVAKPLVKGIFNMDEKIFAAMQEKRKKEAADFVINAIKKR